MLLKINEYRFLKSEVCPHWFDFVKLITKFNSLSPFDDI